MPSSQSKREFSVAGEYTYNRAGPVRWIISHLLRYPPLLVSFLFAATLTNVLFSLIPMLTGQAFDAVLQHAAPNAQRLLLVALSILGIVLVRGLLDITNSWSVETLGQRMERDAREELYVSLLGKSQTFHNRQRVGDIMARATNDVRQLNPMMNPGVALDHRVDDGHRLAAHLHRLDSTCELLLAPAALCDRLHLCRAPLRQAAQPGGRRAALALRRDERRADGDNLRH